MYVSIGQGCRWFLNFGVGLLACLSVLVSPSLGAFQLYLDDTGDVSPGFYVTDDDFAPVAPNQPDAYPGLGRVAYLGNVGSFSVVVTTVTPGVIGGGEHDDRDFDRPRVGLQLAEHLRPVQPGP